MTNEEKLAALSLWQEAGVFHPLTCGGGGGPCSGVSLKPTILKEGNAEFVGALCPDCGRFQNEKDIPPVCFSITKEMVDQMHGRFR